MTSSSSSSSVVIVRKEEEKSLKHYNNNGDCLYCGIGDYAECDCICKLCNNDHGPRTPCCTECVEGDGKCNQLRLKEAQVIQDRVYNMKFIKGCKCCKTLKGCVCSVQHRNPGCMFLRKYKDGCVCCDVTTGCECKRDHMAYLCRFKKYHTPERIPEISDKRKINEL